MRGPLGGFGVMAIPRVAVVALVLATMCSCVSDVGQKEQSSADDVLVTRARLIEGEWRLFSWVYPALPIGSYPIKFEASGRVQTENLASTETWQLTEDLTLQLASKARVPRMSLSYDSEAGVFGSQPEAGPAFVVGPAGFGFAEYLQNLVDDFSPSSITSGEAAARQDATTAEHELDPILSKAKSRIHLDPTWAWAPDRNDQDRFPYFEKHNESRWNLELDPSKIEPGTI